MPTCMRPTPRTVSPAAASSSSPETAHPVTRRAKTRIPKTRSSVSFELLSRAITPKTLRQPALRANPGRPSLRRGAATPFADSALTSTPRRRSRAPGPGTSRRRSASGVGRRTLIDRWTPPAAARSAPRSGFGQSAEQLAASVRRRSRPCREGEDPSGSHPAGAPPRRRWPRRRPVPPPSGTLPPRGHRGRASDSARRPPRSGRTASAPDLELRRSTAYPRQAISIRLVLADDHYLVREGLRRLLETRADLEVVAVCGDLDALLAAVAAERPDVIVTDIRMTPGHADEGIQAAESLRLTNPEIGVVVLSQYANPSYALRLLDGGSGRRAYLLKERVTELEQLEGAVRAVADGGSVIDPKVVEALVAEKARGEESPLTQLTPRERDVLRAMAEGQNNAAIAQGLFLTERSVEKVIHSIFLKLGLTWEAAVHKRVKAVILYLAETD